MKLRDAKILVGSCSGIARGGKADPSLVAIQNGIETLAKIDTKYDLQCKKKQTNTHRKV